MTNYTFTLEEKEYCLDIKIESNKIILEAKVKKDDIPFVYRFNTTLEEFKKKINVVESLEEVKILLENIVSKKDNINGEINNSEEKITLKLNYDFCSLKKYIELDLTRIILSEKKMIEYLTNQVKLLKRIIKSNGIQFKNIKNVDMYKESELIKNNKELDLIKSGIINLNNKNLKLKLIYKASKDGDTPDKFHSKCDGVSPTLTIFKTKDNYIFGGFTDGKWDDHSKDLKTNNTFLFSFNNMKIYTGKNGGNIYCSKDHGPWFSWVLGAYDNPFLTRMQNNQFEFNTVKQHWNEFSKDYELTGGKKEFSVMEIEVFLIEYF